MADERIRSDDLYAGTGQDRLDPAAPMPKQTEHSGLSAEELERSAPSVGSESPPGEEPLTGTVAGRAAAPPVGSLGVEGYATKANEPASPGAADEEAEVKRGL
jgi:hypothetical protein